MRNTSVMNRIRLRSGFTLIELLVVIAIISLLVSLLLPSLKKAKELARGVVCMGNLRAQGVAVQYYMGDNNGVMPALYWKAPYSPNNWDSQIWNVHLSRYTDEKITEYDNSSIDGTIFACPTNTAYKGWRGGNYGYNIDIPPPHGWEARTVHALYNKIEKPFNLRLIGDCTYNWIGWNQNYSLRHTNKTINLLYCDFHVEALNEYEYLHTPSSGY